MRKIGILVLFVTTLWISNSFAERTHKTVRIEHGRPVVLTSSNAVLVLQFEKNDSKEALIPNNSPDIRHCRATYQYLLMDAATVSVTKGEGMVEEILRTIRRSATGSEVENAGSKVGIQAGEFTLWWSEGTAGSKSWLYFQAVSNIRFIQQPEKLRFEKIDIDQLRKYLNSKNVQQFTDAGRSVEIIGPAIFAEDLPSEKVASGKIEQCCIRENNLVLKLSGLAPEKTYMIESSYEARSQSWIVVHSFIPHASEISWSDPLSNSVDILFYRIRQGN